MNAFPRSCVILLSIALQVVVIADDQKLENVLCVDGDCHSGRLTELRSAESYVRILIAEQPDCRFAVAEMIDVLGWLTQRNTAASQLAYIRAQIEALLKMFIRDNEDTLVITLPRHRLCFNCVAVNENRAPTLFVCPREITSKGARRDDYVKDDCNPLLLEVGYLDFAACFAFRRLLFVDECTSDLNQRATPESEFKNAFLRLPKLSINTVSCVRCETSEHSTRYATSNKKCVEYCFGNKLEEIADISVAVDRGDAMCAISERSAHVDGNAQACAGDSSVADQSNELCSDSVLSQPLAENVRIPPNAAGIKFALIPAGQFMMGSNHPQALFNEQPVHRVEISRSFYAGIHEVTIAQTLKWLNSADFEFQDEWIHMSDEDCPVRRNGRSFKRNERTKFAISDDQPMLLISWSGAVAFCDWCSRQDLKFRYRLPTEAEWEYMARAGIQSEYPWGDSLNGFEANIDGDYPFGTDARGPNKKVTTGVGKYPPNLFGLYDTAGNVSEWCSDWYGQEYYRNSPGNDPGGPDSGLLRVMRGGSWYNAAFAARSSTRSDLGTPDRRDQQIGFRIVAEVPQSQGHRKRGHSTYP